jgi:hypothetical protein
MMEAERSVDALRGPREGENLGRRGFCEGLRERGRQRVKERERERERDRRSKGRVNLAQLKVEERSCNEKVRAWEVGVGFLVGAISSKRRVLARPFVVAERPDQPGRTALERLGD